MMMPRYVSDKSVSSVLKLSSKLEHRSVINLLFAQELIESPFIPRFELTPFGGERLLECLDSEEIDNRTLGVLFTLLL